MDQEQSLSNHVGVYLYHHYLKQAVMNENSLVPAASGFSSIFTKEAFVFYPMCSAFQL